MMTCLPTGFCSWDYRVSGGRGEARVMFDWGTESGAIECGGVRWEVVKQGWLSGRWTLERGGEVKAEGAKVSAFLREYVVRVERGELRVVPESMFVRAFVLINEAGVRMGEIYPEHAMTRRATIRCVEDLDELTQLFAFWLVVLSWRRAEQSD